MSNTINNPSDFGDALAEQLGLYQEEVIEALNACGEAAAEELVELTKENAPDRTGAYKRAITYTATATPTGVKRFTWGAKAPEYRKTHLLVNGHEGPNGSRVPGDPFLENALDVVLPKYEENVEVALTNGR